MLANLLPRRRQRTPPAGPAAKPTPAMPVIGTADDLLRFVIDNADDDLRDFLLSRAPASIIAATNARPRLVSPDILFTAVSRKAAPKTTETAPAETLRPAPEAPPEDDDDDALPAHRIPALREIAALKAEMPRVMRPEVLAGFVVQTIREADPRPGYWLPHDVMIVAADICRDHNIEPVLKQVLLGAMECVPGVRYSRYRILQDNAFATIRHRMKQLGRKDDRPHLFWIGEKPAARRGPLRDLDGAAVKPVRRRSDRSGHRPPPGEMAPRVAETREFPEAPDRPARRAA